MLIPKTIRTAVAFVLLTPLAMIAAGCGESADKGGRADGKATGPTQVAANTKTDGGGDSKHSGWWCDEHGIPELECSMCSAKVEKACKAKGDWCDKHERAMSQCFICKPERREFYAAKYRAKYGKEPPPIDDDEKGKPEAKK